jgi:WD40 repeat protein
MRGVFSLCGASFLLILLTSCGGNGGSSQSSPPPPPPHPSFSISLSPASITLMQGGMSQNVQVLVNAQNGFTGSVSVNAGSLPGVTSSPSSLSLAPGAPGNLAFAASSTAGIEQTSITVEGVSGSLTAKASLPCNVDGAPVPDPFHPIGGEFSHGFYDQARQLLFVANNALNEIDVLSGTDLSVRARVPAPQPWGMDQMADGNTLVLGTTAQQIVTLDENTLAVTSHPVPPLGSPIFIGLFYPNVVATANGKVLIIGQEQGIDSSDIIDGGQFLIEWNSADDTFQIVEPGPGQPLWETDHLARSADHKWAIFSGDQFYLYSSDADSFTTVPLSTVSPPQNEFGVRGYAMNADGSKIGVVSSQQATFLDRSFNVLGTTSIPGAFQNSRTNVIFTPDGSQLLLQYDMPLAIEVLDANSYAALGFYSGVMSYEDNLERLLAVDSTGRAFAGISGGIRVIDMNAPIIPNPANDSPPGINNSAWCSLPDTTEIPLNRAEQLSVTFGATYYRGASYYFGGQPAPVLSNGSQIDVPASSTQGGVDIECIGPDGNSVIYEDAFSYGIELLGVSANLLPPLGTPSVYIFGYGFTDTPTISVGGNSVATVAVTDPRTPLQIAQFHVPTGVAGTSSDTAVSSANGSDSLPQAMSYIPSATIVPASGLLQVLYDPHRNLLYALKGTEVDVLNPTTLNWQSPFPIPGAGSSVTYDAMALSPDGSWLAVASPSGYVAVIDPDRPSQASSVATNSTPGYQSGSVAISLYNKAIITGTPNVEVDLSTLEVTPVNQLMGDLVRASADGSHLYGLDLNVTSGQTYSIDPATYAVQTPPQFGELFYSDLAVSPDGNQFAAITGAPYAYGDIVGFYNQGMNAMNFSVYPLVSPPDDTQVLGALFSPAAKIIVSALGDSVEFWDVSTGTLRGRLMTPEELHAFTYPEGSEAPQIALDPTGQTIFAISASGLTVMKLPEPVDDLPAAPWTRPYRLTSRGYGDSGSIAARVAAMHNRQLKATFLTLPAMKALQQTPR